MGRLCVSFNMFMLLLTIFPPWAHKVPQLPSRVLLSTYSIQNSTRINGRTHPLFWGLARNIKYEKPKTFQRMGERERKGGLMGEWV